MPQAEFFARLGFFVIKGFLDEGTCAGLRKEIRTNSQVPANIGSARGYIVDEQIRKSKYAEVSERSELYVKSHLLSLKEPLERHFDLALSGCQDPSFLVYREGDYFRPHVDNSQNLEYPEAIRERRVAVIVFLNGESTNPKPDSYCGGGLIIHGAIEGFGNRSYAFPLIGESGLLIAFRTDVVHEVAAVTSGERYSMVSWFY
jgi:SM-20-related protein